MGQVFSEDYSAVYMDACIKYVEANYPYPITVYDIASHVGLERSYLYRLFKNKKGCSPSDWLTNVRLEHAVKLLEQKSLSITDVALTVGFYDLSHFSRVFKRRFLCTPGEYKV